jgi:hypothetical protein
MKRIKQSFLLSIVCVLFAIISVGVLVIVSNNSNDSSNGFTRKFLLQQSLLLHHIGKPPHARFMCGSANNYIYFDTDTAGLILKTDTALGGIGLVKLVYPFNERIQSLYSTIVDSMYTYIMAGNMPKVIRFNKVESSYQSWFIPANLYSESIVIDSNNFAFRMFEKIAGKWQQVFIKVNPVNKTIAREHDVSQRNNDAGFSTDGHLLYDPGTHFIIYVEYYSNHITCMDTSLQLLYNGHTIDTIKNATVHAAFKKSPAFETITNGTPLAPVNLQSCTAEGKLYIHSHIKADNETFAVFENNAVVDVYNISTGQYLYSFYIPSRQDGHLTDFKVIRNKIIVVYKNAIAIYRLPE